MLDNQDYLSEEQAEHDLVQDLHTTYQKSPEEREVLARVRTRLLGQPVPTMETFSDKMDFPGQFHPVMPFSSRKKRRGFTPSLLIAAALLLVLFSSFAYTFLTLKSSPASPGTPPGSTAQPTEPVTVLPRKGVVELFAGLRLHMVDTQHGWLVGDSENAPLATIQRTTDGGQDWQDVTPTQIDEVASLSILDAQIAWTTIYDRAVSSYPIGVYLTRDGGTSWQEVPCVDTIACHMTFVDENHGWLLQYPEDLPARQLYTTNNGGVSWQAVGSLPEGEVVPSFLNRKMGWLISYREQGAQSLFLTNDGGQTWEEQVFPAPAGIPNGTAPALIQHPTLFNEQEAAIQVGFDQDQQMLWYIYTTTDGGKTWSPLGNPLPASDTRLLAPNLGIAGTLDSGTGKIEHLLRLQLENDTWVSTPIALPPGKSPLLDYSFTTALHGMILISDAEQTCTLYQTNDGGKTWQKKQSFVRYE